jgi:hypothetical protein
MDTPDVSLDASHDSREIDIPHVDFSLRRAESRRLVRSNQ